MRSVQVLLSHTRRAIHSSASSFNIVQEHIKQRRKSFPTLDGEVDSNSNTFQRNKDHSYGLIEKYQKILAISQAGGGERAIARHVKQNKKLLASDRLRLLLDDDEDFLELSPIAGHAMEYGDIARAGVLLGIGKIHGKYCMIIANDGSVKGGTIYPISLQKQLRASEIAQQNRIPCVYAVDTGGAFLPLQAEIFNPGGRMFYNEAILSSLGIPQVAIVCGNCTAGGAYVPTMAQEAVIIQRIGHIFLGGPPLVQAATGEIVSADDLGGAMLHSSVSGCTDYYADNEFEGFQMGRDVVEGFNLPEHPGPQRDPEEPLFDPEEIPGLIPAIDQHEMDVRKVIARIVDGSKLSEFKLKYGSTLVAGLSYIHGYLVGIIANNGEITEQAAAKGAHFIQTCSERHIPLVFLQNTVSQGPTNGYGVAGGNLLRDQAKMMAAVSCTHVPKITVIIGNSIGPTNYLMAGRSTSPNFLFSWPNAVTGMMEKTNLVQQITWEKFRGKDVPAAERESIEKKLLEKYSREMSVFHTSSRVLDDGIILPQDTRRVLGKCLDITSAYLPRAATQFPVIRM